MLAITRELEQDWADEFEDWKVPHRRPDSAPKFVIQRAIGCKVVS
jgi:hypothetical protein